MNSGDLMKSFNYIDPALIERSEKRTDPARTVRMIAAVAAALLLVFGAAFGVAKAAGAKEQANLPEKYAFMSDNEVPADAVLPPSQMGGIGQFGPGYDKLRDLKEMYEDSEAVCIITIRDWLGESMTRSRYKADVEYIFKGEIEDTIAVYQMGSSIGLFDNNPLFTYGDKLLVGLNRSNKSICEGYAAYEITGVDSTLSYLAAAEDGQIYAIDYKGYYSYETEVKLPEYHFTNYAEDQNFVNELYKNIANYDSAVAKHLEEYYSEYYNNKERFVHDGGLVPHVYSLDEIEAFFAGMK